MSSVTLHTVKCPNCNHEQEVERWNSVNDYDKDKFLSIVDKSIFTYECKNCKKTILSPYPLLFHKMGIKDVRIGYKMDPGPAISMFAINPLMAAVKFAMEENGENVSDISERYDNLDEFTKRVAEFV